MRVYSASSLLLSLSSANYAAIAPDGTQARAESRSRQNDHHDADSSSTLTPPFPLFSPEQLVALASIRSGAVTRRDVEVVVAHYAEDASWLTGTDYAGLVTLYSHGNPSDAGLPPSARTVKLQENVGKESHAYLYHIVQNYDDVDGGGLAAWTVFTQAGEPSPGYVDTGGDGKGHKQGGHLVLGSLFDDYVLSYASGLKHYFVASSAVEPKSLEHNIRSDFERAREMEQEHGMKRMIETRGAWGLEERCPPSHSPLWMEKWIDVAIDPNFAPLKAQRSQCGGEAFCPTLREFTGSLDIPGDFSDGHPIVFGQGARFAVSKEVILRHPKSYYERLLDQASHNADPWQGYYFEYLWYHMIAADPDPQAPTRAMCPEIPRWDPPQPASPASVPSLRAGRHLQGGISGVGGSCKSRKSQDTCSALELQCLWCPYSENCDISETCQSIDGSGVAGIAVAGSDQIAEAANYILVPVSCNKITSQASCEMVAPACQWTVNDNGGQRRCRNPGTDTQTIAIDGASFPIFVPVDCKKLSVQESCELVAPACKWTDSGTGGQGRCSIPGRGSNEAESDSDANDEAIIEDIADLECMDISKPQLCKDHASGQCEWKGGQCHSKTANEAVVGDGGGVRAKGGGNGKATK